MKRVLAGIAATVVALASVGGPGRGDRQGRDDQVRRPRAGGLRPRLRAPDGAEEGRPRARADAGHAGWRRRLHAARRGPDQAGRRPPGVVDRPPHPGARGHRGVRARRSPARPACRRCSTTTSAGSPTAARRPTTSTSSTRTRSRSRASGGWRRRSTTPARSCARPRKGGREVILGGHSLGASLTAAYAAWDFNGKPGYQDVDGLVLIDGGLLGSFDAYDLAQAQQQIADARDVEPVPRPARDRDPRGGRAVRRGRRRLRAPRADRRGDDDPELPAAAGRVQARRSRSPTAACFGYAFDRDTSPAALGLLHVNAGQLAATRRPARLGGRRDHPGRPPRRDLRPGARERHRVVLPEAADDRHQRRQRDEDERRRRASSACG